MSDIPRDRVLLVVPGGSFFTDPFLRSFERLGYECRTFDYRRGLVYNNNTVRQVLNRFPRLKVFKERTIKKTNKQLLDVVREYKPKFLFAQKGENIYPETAQTIRAMGVITINFYNDFINQWEGIKKIAPAYDYFFSPDHVVLKKLWEHNLKNCYYLPCAVEPQSDIPTVTSPIYDIAFIGTYNPKLYSSREKYLSVIRDLGLHIWGDEAWTKSSLGEYYHGRAHGNERFDIYRKSKIVIDINWDNLPSEAVNLRPFEVGYSGACLFSDTIRADLSRVFEVGKEFVAFDNGDDLRTKVIHYLEHEGERRAIAKACQEKVIHKHTYDTRVREMLEIVTQKRSLPQS